jgi:hypothetical protein
VSGATIIRPEMTGTAVLPEMDAFQGVTRLLMIKINFRPWSGIMAIPAAAVGVIFLVQEGFMYVLMAIHAHGADLPETPFVGFLMTGETGCCQVSACQFEGGLVMPFDGIVRTLKAKGGMAFGTVRRISLPGKLPVVVIGVAVRAIIVFQGIGVAGFMTFRARNGHVFSFKRVAGHGMFEIPRLPDPVEGFLGMALDTVLAEFIVVDIPVAARAVRVSHTGKFLHLNPVADVYLMAFYAIDLPVASNQRKAGPVMVKFRGRPEGIVIMAGSAIGREGAPVVIGMAGKAGRV